MEPVESKITAKGQISLPASVRRKLNLVPGARIEWCERGDEIVVRRASRYTSQDIHAAVFQPRDKPVSVAEMDEGIRQHIRKKHARG